MKQCKKEGCYSPVFSGGYCKRHQWMRTDKKIKVIKRTPIKRKPRKATGELEVFIGIYTSKKDKWVSQLSGRALPHPISIKWINCFAHILPKSHYGKARLDPKNIFLLHPDEHYLFDQGTEEQRERYAKKWSCSWERLYLLKNTLKAKYNEQN